jgi:[CysO sulfur-carrier protein]-S-L-cysteine hydrolase
MLEVSERVVGEMVGHAYDGLPDEACGLMAARPGHPKVELFVPCRNADASSRTYSIGPDCWAAADPLLDERGLEVIGVMHSHTHTDAYPSPTDVEQAANPLLAGWHYVIVSLRQPEPVVRSYRIDDGNIFEERIVLLRR